MKNKPNTIASDWHDHILEATINEAHEKIKDEAVQNARHFAALYRSDESGESICSYISHIKAKYDKVCADAMKVLMPNMHGPESKFDADFLRKKSAGITQEIKRLESENRNDRLRLGKYNLSALMFKIGGVLLLAFAMTSGELFFNMRAFQIFGDNLLVSLGLSLTVTLAIVVCSHIVTVLYKKAKNTFQKRLVIICSFIFLLIVFTSLAYMRTSFLETIDVHVNPLFFIVFNILFFAASCWLLHALPTWREIKENEEKLAMTRVIYKRTNLIDGMEKKLEAFDAEILVMTKERARLISYAQHIRKSLRMMYLECVALFKSEFMACRDDLSVPECFKAAVPDLETEQSDININHSSTNNLNK